MPKIDMNAARVARREARREKGDEEDVLKIEFGDVVFSLPAEVPFEVVEKLADDQVSGTSQVRGIVDELLRSDAEKFWSQRPSLDDVNLFIEEVMEAYGLTVGESPASEAS